jgi:isochorismate synthase
MTQASFFVNIENQLQAKLPFAVYRKPNEKTVLAIFQEDDSLHTVVDYNEEGFVFVPFSAEAPSVLLKPDNVFSFSGEVVAEAEKDVVITNETCNKEQHLQLVNDAVETIKNSNLEKIVVSRKHEVVVDNFSLLNTFKSVLHTYKTAFCYIWYHPKVGMWMGATPEQLLKVQENTLETVSLAGTMPYHKDQEVAWGAKEIHEQAVVTNYIASVLQTQGLEVKVAPAITHKAGNLLHLQSLVKATSASSINLKVILEELHPTPAVCGLPKEESYKFIINNERYNRNYYTGFLGELNMQKQTNLFVNLRCMQLHSSSIILYVGGGITAQSTAEAEWQETVHKTQTMRSILREE